MEYQAAGENDSLCDQLRNLTEENNTLVEKLTSATKEKQSEKQKTEKKLLQQSSKYVDFDLFS